MLYMVEAHATFERGNEVDDKGGPGPVLGYITERFKPEGFYFIPTRRAVVMMVSLDGDSGGLAAANCRVTTNDAFVVLFGLPGPVVDLPGLVDGPLWIDLQACFAHAASVGPATFPVQLPLPPAVVPTGLQFVWQAVMLSPTGLVLSNPSPSVVL